MVLRLNWLVALAVSFSIFSFSETIFAQKAPNFKKIQIELVQNKTKKTLNIEVAETINEHAYGLMNRTKMPADTGMLFIFDDEQVREFWMKNTLIDLDIAYIDKNKKIIDIQNMKAVTSVLQTNVPTYPSKGPAQYALEMNSGWFKKNKFNIGTQLNILARPTSK